MQNTSNNNNSRTPFISVIIPCYNCEKTIRETLFSLEKQWTKDFEVILINDGSTDDTEEEIFDHVKGSTIKARYTKQENKGVSAARNKGIEKSRGKYLVFLDADDLLANGYLSVAIRMIKEQYPDTICCHRTREQKKLSRTLYNSIGLKVDPVELMIKYTYSKELLGFSTFVYKAEIIKENDIRFPEGVRFGEDVEFLTKFLAHCKTAYELPENAYFYRQSKASVSFKKDYGHAELIPVSEQVSRYLKELEHPFAGRFEEYMKSRAIFHAMHKFAQSHDVESMQRLKQEYDVKEAMKFIARDSMSDPKSKWAARSYLVSPGLFNIIGKF